MMGHIIPRLELLARLLVVFFGEPGIAHMLLLPTFDLQSDRAFVAHEAVDFFRTLTIFLYRRNHFVHVITVKIPFSAKSMFLDFNLFITTVVGKVQSELAKRLIDLNRRSVVPAGSWSDILQLCPSHLPLRPKTEVCFFKEFQCLVASNVTAYTRNDLCQITLVERSNLHWRIAYGKEAAGAGICLAGSVGHQLVDG